MAKISFSGFWSKPWQSEYKIPKGYILLRVKDVYKKNLGIFLNKINAFQLKKNELKELDFDIEIHYKKRTLNQNRLMWTLYTIEANEMNGGMSGKEDIAPENLYDNDLREYAARTEIKITASHYDYYKSVYRLIEAEKQILKNGVITHYYMKVLESSSHFNTVQMANWIDRLFNRLAENGVTCTNPGDIQKHWVEWQQFINDEKIILHDNVTEDEYRILRPLCEACGKFIGNEGGQLAHIVSKGAGGEDGVINRLHLCNDCHIKTQHQKGWGEFLKLFPHLSHKIKAVIKENV